MPAANKANDFINIFEKVWEDEFKGLYKSDKVACVRGELNNSDTFSDMTADKLPAFAAWIAEGMSSLAPTQLRRFYTYVKGIERKAKNEKGALDKKSQAKLMFLLPKLAGNANAKAKESLKVLYDVFAVCILEQKKIKTKSDLHQFVEFFEAILDYHATFDSKQGEQGGK